MFEDDEAGVAGAAAADGEQAAEFAADEGGFVEDGAFQTSFAGEFFGVVGKDGRVDDVAGQVAEGAGVVGGFGDDLGAVDGGFGGRQLGGERETEGQFAQRRGVVISRFEFGEAVVGQQCGVGDGGAGGGIGDGDGGAVEAGGAEFGDDEAGGLAEDFRGEVGSFAEAGEEEAVGSEFAGGVKQEELFGGAAKFFRADRFEQGVKGGGAGGAFVFEQEEDSDGRAAGKNGIGGQRNVHGAGSIAMRGGVASVVLFQFCQVESS